MSINKSTLGTIFGTALLGLAKSKIGGANEAKPRIVFVEDGVGPNNETILIKHVPEDVKDIVTELNGSTYFKIPTNAIIIFGVESTQVKFPDEDSILDELAKYRKKKQKRYFDKNKKLDDEDERKEDWKHWKEVPDWYFQSAIFKKERQLEDEWRRDCFNVMAYFFDEVIKEIYNQIEHSDRFFQRCKRFIGNRNVYLHIDDYHQEWETINNWVAVDIQIFISSQNPMFALNFMEDLKEFLSQNSKYGEFENVGITDGLEYKKPEFIKLDYRKNPLGPMLRKR